jgi:hypothetical protein
MARPAPPIPTTAKKYVIFESMRICESKEEAKAWRKPKHLHKRRTEKMIASCFRVGSSLLLRFHSKIQTTIVESVNRVAVLGMDGREMLSLEGEDRQVVLSRFISLGVKIRHCIAHVLNR